VSIAELFQCKTVARLGGLLSTKVAQICHIPKQSSSQVRLSFAQERLWFIEQYEQGSSAYHIPALLDLEKKFDHEVLKKSIQAIVERHEV
ncbi:condensation domain-containing protein, partial [Lactococcus petauri]|uniref:condensation domain-containing protein n=1 Tax=Lactococcus petauri TaxID=1940789 RepID=UPI0021F23DC0